MNFVLQKEELKIEDIFLKIGRKLKLKKLSNFVVSGIWIMSHHKKYCKA